MENIYARINELVDQKESFVLATILKKSGSLLREEGAKIVVRKDFTIHGTLGGGLLEAMTIKAASKVFAKEESIIENFELTSNETASLGTVCGGNIKVLLEYVNCSNENVKSLYKKAIELKLDSEDFALITQIADERKKINGMEKWICTETALFGIEDEEVWGVVRNIRENFSKFRIQEISIEKGKYLIEPFLNFESVYIFGAGHIAQKIAGLTKLLGFYTIVIDDREEFANRERFDSAEEVKVISAFDHIVENIKINNNSYVIIVTRGNTNDKEILAYMLGTDAKYIGMLGSRNKRDYIFNKLLNQGFTLSDLERVHCPIGLPIFADTTEEIAVSIAAELVKVKRGPRNEKW
jgi:xanthine dehydrogenase accessory factor